MRGGGCSNPSEAKIGTWDRRFLTQDLDEKLTLEGDLRERLQKQTFLR